MPSQLLYEGAPPCTPPDEKRISRPLVRAYTTTRTRIFPGLLVLLLFWTLVFPCSAYAADQSSPTGQASPSEQPSQPGQSGQPEELSVYEIDLTACATDSFGNWGTRLARTSLGGSAYQLAGGLGTKGGKLRMLACVTWNDGSAYYQSDAGWRDVLLSWSSSDPGVATVDSRGIVTAVSDGVVRITVTAPNGVSSSMSIEVFGQKGAYVYSSVITDEAGTAYPQGYITFGQADMGLTRRFYVRLTYSDGKTECNAPGAADYAASFSSATCTWTVLDSEVGYVNAQTGNFKPLKDGHTKVMVTATGGDPTYNGGTVVAAVYIQVDTGTYSDEYAPSSELNIKVIYEEQPELVGKAETFSVAELQSIETAYCTYSLTLSNGKYVTDSAKGIYLITVLDHIGISLNDVAYFQFAANDGANPGNITKSFLFGYTRYYYPYADWSIDTGAVSVMPMLAYADSWREGGYCTEDYSTLNEGTCFRLLFGSTSLADNQTSKSLKYINTMTIVLSGAPPVGWGENGTQPGGDLGQNGGTGAGSGAGMTSEGLAADGGNVGSASVGEQDASQENDKAKSDTGVTQTGSSSGSSRWQVFEMMNNMESDVDPIVFNNPLEPFLVPATMVVVAAGGIVTGVRFRGKMPFGYFRAS